MAEVEIELTGNSGIKWTRPFRRLCDCVWPLTLAHRLRMIYRPGGREGYIPEALNQTLDTRDGKWSGWGPWHPACHLTAGRSPWNTFPKCFLHPLSFWDAHWVEGDTLGVNFLSPPEMSLAWDWPLLDCAQKGGGVGGTFGWFVVQNCKGRLGEVRASSWKSLPSLRLQWIFSCLWFSQVL